MKRLACLALIVCLLLALALPAAAQTAFSDAAAITHTEAVQMLTGLGLISGYRDGSFRPEEPVTRAQIAKLIALLNTDAPNADAASFADVAETSWALPYISYCAAENIVTGSGGLFRPQDDVTAQELCKMLLVTLGYDASRYTGARWAQNVAEDAEAVGLYHALSVRPEQYITREAACQMILNALQSYAVHGFSADGTPLYVLDELMNPRTYLEIRYNAVRYAGVVMANEAANLSGGAAMPAGVTQLAGYHLDFAVSTGAELLGRKVSLYVQNGQVLGVPCEVPEEVCGTFTSAERLQQLVQTTDYRLTENTAYYYNNAPADASVLQTLTAPCTIAAIDHDGDLGIDLVRITDP